MFDMLAQENFVGVGETDAPFSNELLFEAAVALESSFVDMNELTQMSSTIDDLEQLGSTIEMYGVTPSLMVFANRDQLLSSAIPAFRACESMTGSFIPTSTESLAALEGVLGATKEMIASFFKKAWDVLTIAGEKIVDFCKFGYEKVAQAASWTKDKVFNAAKALKEKIVAHPIASVLTAVALAATIGAVVVSIWGPLPMSMEALGAWKTSILAKVNSGLGSAGRGVVSVGKKGLSWTKKGLTTVKEGTGSALGYTKESFNKVVDGARASFADGGTMQKSGTWVASKSKELYEATKAGGEAALKAGRVALGFLVNITHSLWSFVSGGSMSMITSCLSAFRKLFGTEAEVSEYANGGAIVQAAHRKWLNKLS